MIFKVKQILSIEMLWFNHFNVDRFLRGNINDT